MLTLTDSAMSKSVSISNIRLYQFIREKCKIAVVEKNQATDDPSIFTQPKEKWVAMIVNNSFLLNLFIEDIDFKETCREEQEKLEKEKKRLDNDSVKKRPKCQQNYITSKTNHDNCHYHGAFVYDMNNHCKLTREQAQTMTQNVKLIASNSASGRSMELPKLIWDCCLGLYGIDPPCQVGSCGLPNEMKGQAIKPGQDLMTLVQNLFMNNQAAEKRTKDFS
ncbi:unnamed protein product [Rotaria socialis]